MARYPDFLRHIVNTKLSALSKKHGGLLSHVDEIRKEISKAESKYMFSSFGGDPENLAKYLLSDDFNTIIEMFKAANAIDALINILEETKRAYHDLPVVVKAVEKTLEKVNSMGRGIKSRTDSLRELHEYVKEIFRDPGLKIRIEPRENSLLIRIGDNGNIVLKPRNDSVEALVSASLTIKKQKLKDLQDKIIELLGLEWENNEEK